MVASAQIALKKELTKLSAQKVEIDKKVSAITSALAALGAVGPKTSSRRLRKPMSASERKSVSRRMKAYWAKKRAEKR